MKAMTVLDANDKARLQPIERIRKRGRGRRSLRLGDALSQGRADSLRLTYPKWPPLSLLSWNMPLMLGMRVKSRLPAAILVLGLPSVPLREKELHSHQSVGLSTIAQTIFMIVRSHWRWKAPGSP